MSNTQVGQVYQQIIADVVESSRVDFEEGGVDEHVLEELRMGWQQKLSQLQVATFPWDPKPEPQPAPPIANPPTVPSNAGNYAMNTPPMNQAQPQPGLTMPQMNNQMTNGGHPNGQRIKAEPEDQPQYQPNPGLTLPQGVNTAQARAAAHLQNNYGSRAAASINAIQGSVGSQGQPGMQPGQQQGPPNPQIAQQMQAMHQQQYQQIQAQRAAQAQAAGGIQQPGMQQPPRPQMTQEQYRQLMAEQAARQRQHLQQGQGQPQNGLPKAQTDGAGDEVETLGVVRGLDASGEEVMGRVEIDGMIRRKIEAMGQSMEGGGLMLPLHKASTSSKRQRKVKRTIAANGMPQTDGPDDDDDNKNGVKDEDLDEDAINSDLDDPDDGLNEEEDDDEALNHIMLCMYDKVQRVKNKWKCVMKDGVLTVNGKEYVFHKASGEYEW